MTEMCFYGITNKYHSTGCMEHVDFVKYCIVMLCVKLV